MTPLRAMLFCVALVVPVAADAADDAGIVTLADAGSRVLRGATWYRLVPGARLEESDIVEAAERAQFQLELDGGSALNVVGPGTLYVTRAAEAGSPDTLAFSRGWMKASVKPPGLRVRTPQAEVVTTGAVIVMRVTAAPEIFIESGEARLVELSKSGAERATHEMKRGEHWSPRNDGRYAMVPRAPKPFVDAMPRHYTDALPALAAKFKSAAELPVDREITYAEAQPWLAGRERAAFERRFAGRLRDPAFRRAVEPHVARYPSWDRMLHPEKYLPKPPATP
jgi:hypothetical protein